MGPWEADLVQAVVRPPAVLSCGTSAAVAEAWLVRVHALESGMGVCRLRGHDNVALTVGLHYLQGHGVEALAG